MALRVPLPPALLLGGLLPLVALMAPPADAKVLATGKPTADGLYWLKIEKANGSTYYQCRSQKTAKIQKSELCEKGGARKP